MSESMWKKFRVAFRSVTANYREYLSFAVALFILQGIFWMTTFAADTNNTRTREKVYAEYDYHILVENMSSAQAANLYNDTRHIRIMNEGVNSITVTTGGTARVILYDSHKLSNADRFVKKYIEPLRESGDGIIVTYTPLLTYESGYRSGNNLLYFVTVLLTAAVAVLMLSVLMRVRLAHASFRYGIYLTFGADFKRLYRHEAWELTALSLLTLLPSGLLAGILTARAFAAVGVASVCSFGDFLLVLAISLAVVLISVYLPSRAATNKMPMELLAAGDGSREVSSPRRSSLMVLRKPFTRFYAILSVWRYRRYTLRLLAGAVGFCTLFLACLTLADMRATAGKQDIEEYTLVGKTASDAGEAADMQLDSEELIREINSLDAVKYTLWSTEMTGVSANSHILAKEKNKYNSALYSVPYQGDENADGYTVAFSDFSLVAADRLYLETLTENALSTFLGDPYSMLKQENTVIVSESIHGEKHASFSVGDTILIAHVTRKPTISSLGMSSSNRLIVQKRLENWRFEYTEYTVGAVILDSEWSDGIRVLVSDEDYGAITETFALRTELHVYVSSDTLPAELDKTSTQIVQKANFWGDWQITPNHAAFDSLLTYRRNDRAFILAAGIGFLLLSPVIWFYSQRLFWRKRKGEMVILSSLGVTDKQIRRIVLSTGGVMALVSFVFSVVAGLLVNALMYGVCNRLLPLVGVDLGVGNVRWLSLPALAVCVVLAVVCGFLSTILPVYTDTPMPKKRPAARKSEAGKKGMSI